MSDHPREIVIVGRDAALWLTATALAEALAPIGTRIAAVELPSQLTRASVYATLPAIETLHARLGIDEAALLRSTGGSFSLGWNIVPAGLEPVLLAHGSYGAPIDGSDFFPYWLKASRFGLDVALENFSPTAMAARHGRILVPDEKTETFGRTDYGYHLPAVAYAGLLKTRAQRLGVTIRQTVEVGVELGGDRICSITADDGMIVRGDLFVDASGSDAVLIGSALGVQEDHWSEFFPHDRVLTATGARLNLVPAYADLRLAESSWTALQGTQVATHVVHAYAGDGIDAETALIAATKAAGVDLADVAVRAFSPSMRRRSWSLNCVAIGAAACAFDPLFDLDLHAVQLGIVQLLSLFPNSGEGNAERDEFNRITRSLFERLRDFQSALFFLSGSAKVSPSSLQQKIDAFEARAAVAPMEDETFSADQWRALFTGLGLEPETWTPSIDNTQPEQMKAAFRRVLGFVHDKVLEQPQHDDYLASIGGSIGT